VESPASRPTPLFGERALHLPDAGVVAVGDVHIGLESDLRNAGIHLPSQTLRMRARLEAILARTEAKRLIVIGDLKHKVPYSTSQEIRELPTFFRGLPAKVELVPGNHDVDLAGLIDVEVHDATGILVDETALLHGHTWPSEEIMTARTVVTCHNHPAVLLMDELGHRHKEPAWIRAPFTDVARKQYPMLPGDAQMIVMPAFNELTGGTAFNALEGGRLLGPLFGNGLVDADSGRVFTIDGVDLGTVGSLKRFGDDNEKGRKRREKFQKRRAGWIE
jgi:putative SbcD/Mre11-related phosphoesterase